MTFTLPQNAGLGLKAKHYDAVLAQPKSIGWLEVHPENYMGQGGAPHHYLTKIREHYPLSMHGVGMSLGSNVEKDHLQKLKSLVDRYQPAQVSEHLSWSHWNSIHLNDLLPLPLTQETLSVVCNNIDLVQTTLGRQILVENPSTYISFREEDFDEPSFLAEVANITQCGLLLDINNIAVSAHNNKFDGRHYLNSFPTEAVQEVHLAGHAVKPLIDGKLICIDDHGSAVKTEVWDLYHEFLTRCDSPVPTLIEWDTDVPEFSVLLAEATKADTLMQSQFSHEKFDREAQ